MRSAEAPLPARWALDERHVEVIHLQIGAGARWAVDALSPEEQARAARFLFQRDRVRYANARAAVRQILGACLEVPPDAVRLTSGVRGKPAVAHCGTSIRFNLSHSGDHAVVAVALGRELGIDLERVREDIDHAGIAQDFSAGERAAIQAQPATERPRAFFRCWVAKEAYLKARGDGLSAPLSSFEVDPSAIVEALRWSSLDGPGRRWRVTPVQAPPGHVAALACEAGDWSPRHWSGLEVAPRSTR